MASSDHHHINAYLSMSRNPQLDEPICCPNRSSYIPKQNTRTLRQSSRMEIFTLFCVNYYELQGGYSNRESLHYFIFCDTVPFSRVHSLSGVLPVENLVIAYSSLHTYFYPLMETVKLCIVQDKFTAIRREIAFKIKEVIYDKMLHTIK
jgi:hypothetical protein